MNLATRPRDGSRACQCLILSLWGLKANLFPRGFFFLDNGIFIAYDFH
jgi:hypothetical protein